MTSPIITVTLNPAIDLTVSLDQLLPGKVQRAKAAQSNVGGKGINVAGCVADWGIPIIATGVLGRANDSQFTEFFTEKGIEDRFIRYPGETRTNIKIADRVNGHTTDINLPGLPFDEETQKRVIANVMREIEPGSIVVLAGSVPLGLPDNTWAELICDLNRHKARVVLDTSGAPLARALESPQNCLPRAIKPNRLELEAYMGRPMDSEEAIVSAALEVQARGIDLVVVSRGELGAIFVHDGQAFSASLPAISPVSTVGAGDAMVAGIATAIADNLALEALIRRAVAFATSKLAFIGARLPQPDDVRAMARKVQIREVKP